MNGSEARMHGVRRLMSRSELRRIGKARRRDVIRSSHGGWNPPPGRPDPVGLLMAQDEGRVPSLVPIKYGRMLASPFAFLRGSAAVMTSDLASTPASGLVAQLCGDAHLMNFGLFASPERTLVFDINDFDETHRGPWEWDLKRLAASAVVAGRDNGFDEDTCLGVAVRVSEAYRSAMDHFAGMNAMGIWYYQVDAELVDKVFRERAKKADRTLSTSASRKARGRTHDRSLAKLTEAADGRRLIRTEPPLLVPLREIAEIHDVDPSLAATRIRDAWSQYLDSLPPDRQHLLARYRVADLALRVGGVGSVGTRCAIALLEGRSEDDALILQYKEAGPSVVEPYVSSVSQGSHARRVVEGQRLMQTTSDIFLGWHTSEHSRVDYYWRQLKDMKGSMDVGSLSKSGLATYVELCSWCLGRAHARSGDLDAIRGYVGKGGALDEAIGRFAVAYADQTELDYEALVAAEKAGRIQVEHGI